MSKTKKNVNKSRKLSKTKKAVKCDERIVFEPFEEKYEKSIRDGMKQKHKKYLSQVEVLLDKSRNSIFKKQNS